MKTGADSGRIGLRISRLHDSRPSGRIGKTGTSCDGDDVKARGGDRRQRRVGPEAADPSRRCPIECESPPTEAGLQGLGAEHGVRTGDLRLGKANRRRHQRLPVLHNDHQPSKNIWAPYHQSSVSITNGPQPCTAVLFHRCSKTVRVRSRFAKRQFYSGGRGTRSGRPASEESSRTCGII